MEGHNFNFEKIADHDGPGYAATDRITVINGAHSSITHMMIKSAGKIIYDTDNLHNVTYVKNLLCKLIFCVNSKLYNI